MSKKTKIIVICAAIAATLAIAAAVTAIILVNRKPKIEVYTMNYIYGYTDIATTYAPGNYIKDSFYYADEWFLAAGAEQQNNELALASMQLAASAVEAEDSKGIKFLKDIGFEETGLTGFDTDDPEGFNYTWGKKTIGQGRDKYDLIAIVVQSYSFDRNVKDEGWQQNFTVNGPEETAEHYGFSKAVDKMVEGIKALGTGNKVKFWITGHSRAGAIANILAARLGSEAKDPMNQIYAYTFESPATVEGSKVEDNETKYAYIHNYYCDDDIVTMVPPWGMTTYGVRHLINSDEAKAKFPELLKLSGSPAAEIFEEESDLDAKKKSEQIIKVMSDRIATRSDYTKEFKDEFTDASGNKVTMTYVYQDIFVKLMGDIFSDKNSTFNTDEITSRMNDLSDVMKHLASAQKDNSDADYLEATRLLSDVLKSGDITITLDESEVFGLLKLAAPILVPLDELEAAGEAENAELVPFMTFAAQVKRLVVSHQFESSVVYLKELAGGPELDSFDPQTGTPSAGASIKDTEEAIVKATVQKDALDRSYVAGAAKFQTDDSEFADNKVYYLEYTITSIGHAVPDDFKLTIGTKTPIKPATVTYADGCYTMSAVFKFTIGTPKDMTLTYDSQGHGQAPDALKIPEGTILRYDQEMPDLGMVKEGDSSWSFKAWEATDGSGWDNITCNEDVTLEAVWLKVIDTVSFSYELPGKGETITISDIQLPEGAPYKVTEVKLMDGTWGDVDKVNEDGQYIIAINITPDDDTIVYSETDESGYQNFIVRYMTNGQEREVDYETFDVYYTADDGYFGIQIFFTLSPEGIKEGRIPEDQE